MLFYVYKFTFFKKEYYIIRLKYYFLILDKKEKALESLRKKMIRVCYAKDALYQLDEINIETHGLNFCEKQDIVKIIQTEIKHFYCDFFRYFYYSVEDIPEKDIKQLNKCGYYIINNIKIK